MKLSRNRIFPYLVLLLPAILHCQRPQSMDHAYTNHLIHESSPYLLQHAHNPVNWYPWNEEALALAKKDNKLLLISIGYSSCHWCHVMERESFEDTTVARIMNEHFVCIKVDREERPDIDDVYMTACQLSSGGNCGWPLNSFALPDGRPVWAGTYFPRKKWIEVLEYFVKTYSEEPEKMNDYAGRLAEGIQDHGLLPTTDASPSLVKEDDMLLLGKWMMERIDPVSGGRRGAPKFPMPNNWDFLMHYAYRYKDEQAARLVKVTLDKMMRGGIYDQLEGGFSRYSTDSVWLVPHFEKMLYDNGQLISTYANAYAWTGDEAYLHMIHQTIQFIEKNWSDPSGGFYCSYDADSEHEEGKYYVWTEEELTSLIPDEKERQMFFEYQDISQFGNWEHGKNILHLHRDEVSLSRQYGYDPESFSAKIKEIYTRLLAAKKARVMPGLDDKILASWNGLMLKGLADAYAVSSNPEFLDRALRNATFVRDQLIKKGDGYRMDRNFKHGKSTINAFLDDYAITISAYLALYQVTFDNEWLELADKLAQYTLLHFDGDPSGLLYYTSDLDPQLITRKIDFSDNVIPSANSIMARNFFALGSLLDRQDYLDKSMLMLACVWPRILKDGHPSFYSNWCQLALDVLKPPYEVAVVGSACTEKLVQMRKAYRPDALYLGAKSESTLPLLENKYVENQTLIYVCQNKVCKLPTPDVAKALQQMTP